MIQEALSHAPSQVHRKGDLGDEVDGMKGDTIKLLSGDDDRPKRGALRNTRKTRVASGCVLLVFPLQTGNLIATAGWKRRRRLQGAPKSVERCRCSWCTRFLQFQCRRSRSRSVRLLNVRTTARVDVSVKEKGLWLACQSVGNSTGGCVREGEGAVACLPKRRQQHAWTCPRPHGSAVGFFF